MIEERIQDRQKLNDTAERGGPLTTADLARRSEPVPVPVQVQPTTGAPEHLQRVPLFHEGDLNEARDRWQDVQGSFVDNPQTAVRDADELVASLMSRLAQMFADERGKLEKDWDQGSNVSTEDLRLALQRYRSFFDRLLSV